MTDAQIAALERAETAVDLFNDRECAAFAFADEVLNSARCTNDMFAAMHPMFSPREVVELLLLIGYFRMILGPPLSRW